jgi:cell division septation protein DedD
MSLIISSNQGEMKMTKAKTLADLEEELDAFNATLNDENDDTPENLAEQERFFKAIAKAKAAKPSKAKAKPAPKPEPEPTPAAEPDAFSVAAYAKQHGLDGRELRKKLRAGGLRAPYTLEQVEKAVKS